MASIWRRPISPWPPWIKLESPAFRWNSPFLVLLIFEESCHQFCGKEDENKGTKKGPLGSTSRSMLGISWKWNADLRDKERQHTALPQALHSAAVSFFPRTLGEGSAVPRTVTKAQLHMAPEGLHGSRENRTPDRNISTSVHGIKSVMTCCLILSRWPELKCSD